MKRQRTILLVCFLSLCLSLAALPTTACAATYQITDEQLNRLETIFAQLQTINSQLSSDLTASKEDLTKLKAQLQSLSDELTKARAELIAAQSSLKKANESLETYARETREQIKSLRFQRNLAVIGILVCLIAR